MVKLQQICLRTWYHSIRHAAWSIEYSNRKATRSKSLYQTCHLILKLIRQGCCYIVNATCHSVYRVAKPRQHLSIYACWPSVFTAINTAAVQICLLVECCCKMDVCWTVATQSASLSIFSHSVLHVCSRCASLSAISAISNAFWCGPHYRSCLLTRNFTICNACWSIAAATAILLVECRWKKDGCKSGATYTDVPLHQTCLLIRCQAQICQLV